MAEATWRESNRRRRWGRERSAARAESGRGSVGVPGEEAGGEAAGRSHAAAAQNPCPLQGGSARAAARSSRLGLAGQLSPLPSSNFTGSSGF